MKLVKVFDDYTKFFCLRIKNEAICCVLSCCQLVIIVASFFQHVVSLWKYNTIFLCRFNQTHLPEEERSVFLSADIIIFDYGLFHALIGVDECIANHLDGGYMRALWCLGQAFAILMLLAVPCMKKPHPFWLVPALASENFYVLGMLILTLATIDKLLTVLLYGLTFPMFLKIFTYATGGLANFFFNYVLWHYYWHLEAMHKHNWVTPQPV